MTEAKDTAERLFFSPKYLKNVSYRNFIFTRWTEKERRYSGGEDNRVVGAIAGN